MQSSLRRKQCTIKRGALMQEARARVVRAVFALLGVVSGVGVSARANRRVSERRRRGRRRRCWMRWTRLLK